MELLVKIVNNFKLQTIFAKSLILDVPQVLSSPLTTINQTFLMKTKELYHQSYIKRYMFFVTVVLTTQPRFYLFKVNNRNTKNTRATCEICLKLAVRTPERRQWHRTGVFLVNFQQVSHIDLVFPSVTLINSIIQFIY